MNFFKKIRIWLGCKRFELNRAADFKRRNIKVAKGSYLSGGVKIGDCTRINSPSYITDCSIGSFCAIGGRLVVRNSNHSINTINMQDWAQSKIIESDLRVVGFSKGDVEVGNGVWIGDSVIILPGVKVGNGAVIGAGSVVTKSVPPYAIVVGNPAKVIKYRFSPEIIELIKDVQWWNWTYDEMRRAKAFFEIDFKATDAIDIKKRLKEMGVI
ncbi:CatB-related O-acetyltransferase [Halomonas urmiana]|uniref:CatB-related O-acetyltransferase n=2 Tax=Halomonas urmiana TaxID=490901 RepID=A0A5R8M7P0_9GAMM|nr:CatB-related O-acetyltransferase [Halomonas urmiana]